MRVASRRLRAVLEIFEPCFPPKAHARRPRRRQGAGRRARRAPRSRRAPRCSSRSSRARSRRPTAPASRSSPSACDRAGRGQRGARRRPGHHRADRPAWSPCRAERRGVTRERPPEVVRSPAAGGRVKARTVKGLDPDATLADNRRADRRDAPRRAVRRSCPKALDPARSEGAARHAHRRQAPALHPRGRRRAVLRPVRRRRRSSAPGTCRTCSARSTTATSSSRACARCRTSCAPPTRWRRARRAGDAPDLDPTLAVGHAARRGLARPRDAVHLPRGAPRAALRALPGAVARARARGLPRAPRVRDQRAARAADPAFTVRQRRPRVGRRSLADGHRWLSSRRSATSRRRSPRASPTRATSTTRGSTSTASCPGWSSTTRVLELAEEDDHAAAGAPEVPARSTPPTSTSSSWSASPACTTRSTPGIDDPGCRTAARRRRSIDELRERIVDARRAPDALLAATSCARRWPSTASASSRCDEVGREERDALDERFRRQIFPVLTPLAVGLGRPFPYISNLSLSLAVLVRDPQTQVTTFARVKVPKEMLPRFVPVGRRAATFVPLEELIAANLDALFPGMEIVDHGFFRVTRDADFDDLRRGRRPAAARSRPSCAGGASARSCASRSTAG